MVCQERFSECYYKGENEMEVELLTKIGYAISLFVNGGYVIAGSYLVKTGFRYFSDYKESVDKEVI